MELNKNSYKTIAIIPARGGSKGLKDKNIQKLHGHPLLAYPIHLAVKSEKINKVILSTDNTNYASIGKTYGADIPFIRPNKISNDTSTTEETLKYSLLKAEEYYDEKYDICIFLTATDVFRKLEDLEKCINALEKEESLESCFMAQKTTKNYWEFNSENKYKRILPWMKEYANRQVRKSIFREDTGRACASRSYLWREGKRIGDNIKIIPTDNTIYDIDIHSSIDLYIADKIIQYLKNNEVDLLPELLK